MSLPSRGDWRVTIGVISGAHFFSHFYVLTLPPLFPLLRSEFVLSNTELGVVAAAVSIGGLLQAPVGGLVDRVGAKWVLVVGLGATAGGIAAIGLGRTYPALLALTLLSGLGQSAFHPADYALINAVTDPSLEGRAFGVHTFSGFAGFAAAPVVVGTLGVVLGWRSTLAVVGVAGLLYTVFVAVALDPEYRSTGTSESDGSVAGSDDRALRSALLRPGLVAMVGFFVAMALASKGVQTFTTLLAVDVYGLPEALGNTLLTAFFGFGAVGVLLGGVLADRYQPGRIIVASLALGAAVLALTLALGDAVDALALAGLFGLIGLFTSLMTPARDRLVSGLSADGTLGQSFGIVFTGGAVGLLVGPVALGAVSDATSLTLAFVVIAAIYLAAGLIGVAIGRRWFASPP